MGKGKKKHYAPREKAIIFADDDGQLYGIIEKALGNCRFTVKCVDGTSLTCRVRGSIKKRTRVRAGDVVIVSIREFDDKNGDILYKYTDKHVLELKAADLIPSTVRVNEVDFDDMEDDAIAFDFDEI
jgi:translation initiation factor 1A